jgi:hypothetical protein
MPKIRYNERSWAIDLISELNNWLIGKNLIIKRAGGENTIKASGGNLFPDVLLFGDEKKGKILQGWELKMPDTPISDSDFVENAKRKALSLSLNSFLVWNVSAAVLYIFENKIPKPVKTWNNLASLHSRDEVQNNKNKISLMLNEILNDINSFLQSGKILPSNITEVLGGDSIADLILNNIGLYTQTLKTEAQSNSSFNNEITLWWRYAKNDYPEENNKFIVLSRNNLLFLTNKFLFAHILKSYQKDSAKIDSIDDTFNIEDVEKVFASITSKCNFWNIFQSNIGEKTIPKLVLKDILSFHLLLKEFNFNKIDKPLLHDLIGLTIYKNKRKVAGQFTTPIKLSALLANLTLQKANEQVIDPCCGSGTILKEVYKFKRKSLDISDSLKTIWGNDKFSLPLQIAAFNFTAPEMLGEIIQLFKEDVINLKINKNITFHEPFIGKEVERKIPEFNCVVSNLPFVKQENIEELNPGIRDIINSYIQDITDSDAKLDGRSDLYAYLPFYLWSLMKEGGRMGIIISNSWLGTSWGQTYFQLLKKFFNVLFVVTSGNGRWFKNAKVVTNIVILEKIKANSNLESSTKFVVTKKKINQYSQEEIEEIRALAAIKNNIDEADITINTYDKGQIQYALENGLNLNSFFADNSWLKDINGKLVNASTLFTIARGERRGWDKLFYPNQKHSIEKDYLKPVLKSPRSIKKLIANSDAVAFCCDKSLEDLEKLNHNGALSWINKFAHITNKNGIPLTQSLARSGTNWYTMSPSTMGELVTSINFGDRLFVALFEKPTFVNQRLIRFTRLDKSIDLSFVHALMNSVISLYYLEAMGTGRGEGALDLSKNKIEKDFRLPNPNLFNKEQKSLIISLFNKIKTRPIYNIEKELNQKDRECFDLQIFKILEQEKIYNKVKKSLLMLYKIRFFANNQ